jgi:predicted phosphodiesterase
MIDEMGQYFCAAGASFALSGGDWFNDTNTRETAIQNMKDIDARMRKAFGENFYLVIGNHDHNYQTWDTEKATITKSPHWLTIDEINAAWYADQKYGGRCYYSFAGKNTTFYAFNSGIDWWHTEMCDFDIEQVTWFLDELAAHDDAHIALAPHMLYISGKNFHPGTAKLLEIAELYNARKTVSFGEKLYDFSEKTGRVEFLIAGHSHRDEVSVYNGIPCILTVNNGVSCPSFDLVAVDYEARSICLTRINAQPAEEARALDRTVSLD